MGAGRIEKYVEWVAWDLRDTYGDLEPIDCGSHGCVFKTSKDRVLKVADLEFKGDAVVGDYLLSHPARGNRHLPQFYSVASHQMGESERYWLVEREDLADVPNMIWPYGLGSIHGEMERIVRNYAFSHPRHEVERILDEQIAKHLYHLKGFGNAGRTFWERAHKLIRAEKAVLLWGVENGFALSDFHSDNWGMRGDVFVVRDLSGAVTSKVNARAFWKKHMQEFYELHGRYP